MIDFFGNWIMIWLKIRAFIDFEDDGVNWNFIFGKKDKPVFKSWKVKGSAYKKKWTWILVYFLFCQLTWKGFMLLTWMLKDLELKKISFLSICRGFLSFDWIIKEKAWSCISLLFRRERILGFYDFSWSRSVDEN